MIIHVMLSLYDFVRYMRTDIMCPPAVFLWIKKNQILLHVYSFFGVPLEQFSSCKTGLQPRYSLIRALLTVKKKFL